MKQITFHCRVLTPMFIAGADGVTPELRAPSLKGAMRYWWRAVQAEGDLDRLKKTEAGIFGGVGEEGGKSSFRIRITRAESLRTNNYRLLPHHSGDRNCFCVAINDERCSRGVTRRAFSPGQEFSVELSCGRLSQAFPPERLQALFTLTSILGGLGKRSRRGLGSYEISGIGGRKPESVVDLGYIGVLLNTLAPGKFCINANGIVLNGACDGRYPFIREIVIGREYASAETLLETVGMASHDHDVDYLGFVGMGQYKGQRLASPVYVSVVSAGGGRFRPVITTLNTVSERSLRGDIAVQQAFKVAIL